MNDGATTGTDLDENLKSVHETILDAAFSVFCANGYARTTTRGLAEAAGITEVTLFRHFGNKAALFMAVIERFGGYKLWDDVRTELSGDYREDLLGFGRRFMRIAFDRGKVIRLMFGEADHFPELREALATNSRELREALSGYFGRQIERGAMRRVDPIAAAQAFWGMMLSYGLVADTLKEGLAEELTPEEAVERFVDIFVEGTTGKG